MPTVDPIILRGRLLRAVDSLSGQTRLSFSYDASGRLLGVADAYGNETRFVWQSCQPNAEVRTKHFASFIS